MTVDIEQYRGRLFGLAYRMLGSRVDAEDMVQEALLRFHRQPDGGVRTPEAWLMTTTTRLCLDRLRERKNERERYVGPWLPEPLVGEQWSSPSYRSEIEEDLSTAFLLVLERLSPDERAAFLLHDAFTRPYPEIAGVLDKNEATCRQLVHRARERVRSDRRRYVFDENQRRELIGKLLVAIAADDHQALLSVLSADVAAHSDGGGKATAALNVVRGSDRVARFLAGIYRKAAGTITARIVPVGAEAGVVVLNGTHVASVMSFAFEDGKISAIFTLVNPEKLSLVNLP